MFDIAVLRHPWPKLSMTLNEPPNNKYKESVPRHPATGLPRLG
jgi:hypothetical protein